MCRLEKKTDAKLLLHHISQDTTYGEGRKCPAPLDWTGPLNRTPTNTKTTTLLSACMLQSSLAYSSLHRPAIATASRTRNRGKKGHLFPQCYSIAQENL